MLRYVFGWATLHYTPPHLTSPVVVVEYIQVRVLGRRGSYMRSFWPFAGDEESRSGGVVSSG